MDVREMAGKYLKMREHSEKIKAKTEEAIGETVNAALATGSAFGFGFLNGYSPAPGQDHHEIASGVPTDAATGLVFHFLAFFGAAGQYGEYSHALGTGGLCSWGNRMGQKMGAQRRLSTGQVRGAFGVQGPAHGFAQGAYGAPYSSPYARAAAGYHG
jgi:hypothetical protein